MFLAQSMAVCQFGAKEGGAITLPLQTKNYTRGVYEFHDEACQWHGRKFGNATTEVHERKVVRVRYCAELGGHESFRTATSTDRDSTAARRRRRTSSSSARQQDEVAAKKAIRALCPVASEQSPSSRRSSDQPRYIAVVMRGESFRGHYDAEYRTGYHDSGTCGTTPADKQAIRQSQRFCTKSVEEMVFALEGDGYTVDVFGVTYECTNGEANPFLTNKPPWYSPGGPPPLQAYIRRFCFLPRSGSSQALNFGYALGLAQDYAAEKNIDYEYVVSVRFDTNVALWRSCVLGDYPVDLQMVADHEGKGYTGEQYRASRYVAQDQMIITPRAWLPATIAATTWPILGKEAGARDLFDFTSNLWQLCPVSGLSQAEFTQKVQKTCEGVIAVEPWLGKLYTWIPTESTGVHEWELPEGKGNRSE
jgi:hypothetical protein